MTKLLLSLHVLAAILAVGPVAVAASMFPPFARKLFANTGEPAGQNTAQSTGQNTAQSTGQNTGQGTGEPEAQPSGGPTAALLLHRICRVYAVLGVAVPVFGLATGSQLGVLGDAWLVTSMVLTVLAAALLGAVILPRQARLLGAAGIGLDEGESAPRVPDPRAAAARLAMATGAFNLLWAVVVVLMIVRPGSTTGA
ncbi:PT domain-containing protein [Streptomyces albus]|uniref:PT domain-containing protein n=1 Tax=Streptomyces albus TaxID=1888 RepID=UPI003453EDA9